MGISTFNPSLGPKVYRRYTAWQIDAGGRPIRQLLLHEDEPHDQDDTPDDLVLVSIPPRFADPIWNRQENVWYEGSISARVWRFCRLLIPMLLAVLLAATLAKAQEPYRMPFPIWEHLRAQAGAGGVSGVPPNAVLLQGRFLNPTAPTDGQVLKWNTANSWWIPAADAGGASPLTTKGDLFTFTTVDARLPVGTNSQCLTADSTQATGLLWASCSGAASAWSAITNPTANLSLSHAAFTTTFTWGAATGASVNLWSFADTLNNTGTGFIFDFNRASGSALAGPYRYRDNGVAKVQIAGTGRTRFATEVSVYETADVADNTNFSMFDIFSSGTTWRLQAHAAGTGVLRPILLGFDDNITFTERARLSTSGGFSLGTGGIDPGAGILNVDTGFRIGNAATAGNYLRGNATNFVSAAIADADIPGSITRDTEVNVTGTAGEITVTGSPGVAPVVSVAASLDLTGKTATAPIKAGTSAATPGTCLANKDFYIKTDATPAGQQLFLCNSTGNGFNLVGDGGGGGIGTIFAGNMAANTVAASSTYYIQINSSSLNAAEGTSDWFIPVACTAKRLYIRNNVNAQPASGTLVITVRKNAVNTAVTVTFANADGQPVTKSDTTNTAAFAAGDLLSISLQNNATTASTNLYSWGLQCQ